MEAILRSTFVYIALIAIFRLTGKRSLAQITTFDFILLLIVSEATQQALIGEDGSITNALLVILTLLFLTGLFEELPEATLAAVVIAALIELVDIPALRRLYRVYSPRAAQAQGISARADFIAAVAALLGVLVFDTLPGLFIGIAISILLLTIAAGTPLVFAALGELVTEKSGVLNLGVEGMMLVGAIAAFAATAASGSAIAGVAAGMAAGAAMAGIFGVLTLTLMANQVAAGLALAIAEGAAKHAHKHHTAKVVHPKYARFSTSELTRTIEPSDGNEFIIEVTAAVERLGW